jgi:SAM-dependent methyltransferase
VNYAEITDQLRRAYATSAHDRDQKAKERWKLDERTAFLDHLIAEGRALLVEIGAGTGQDSAFFKDNGLDVVATDLTPEMVEFCLNKGLDARVMDACHLDLPHESFDAAWSINTLLHVPDTDMPRALAEIARVLRPEGLFYLGVYGGDIVEEGVNEDDWHDPPRFFSFRSDEMLNSFVSPHFEIVDFHVLSDERSRFQSFTLRKPS